MVWYDILRHKIERYHKQKQESSTNLFDASILKNLIDNSNS